MIASPRRSKFCSSSSSSSSPAADQTNRWATTYPSVLHNSCSLRRRFQQNQEDCTYTVLALLPTAATKILETLDVEKITLEIQQMKGGSSRGAKSDSVSLPETTTTTMADEDGQSMLSTSESGVHASQALLDGDKTLPEKPKRTKRQLWGDVTISCTCACLPPSPPPPQRRRRLTLFIFAAQL